MEPTQQQFDQAYWASQPPAIQALQSITDQEQRATVAARLATRGFTIDVPIMVWGWDAFLMMTMRAQFGYTWVPSALQPSPRMIRCILPQAPSKCLPTFRIIRRTFPRRCPRRKYRPGTTQWDCNPSETSIFRYLVKRIRMVPHSPTRVGRLKSIW
jgi:hypothetical protein